MHDRIGCRRLAPVLLVVAFAAGALVWSDTSVTSNGAVGDGTTDSTGALQRALDEAPPGAAVLIPAGEFLVTQPLRLKANAHLRGAGMQVSILRLQGEGPNLLYAEDSAGITVEDLTLRGSGVEKEAEESGGLHLALTQGEGLVPVSLRVERVRCQGFRGSGVVVTATGAAVAEGVTLRDCDFADLAMHGFLGYFARRVLVDHCSMTRMGRSGTIFARCWDVTVRDCHVKTTGWHGVEVGDETEGFLIEGNRIEDCGDHAGILAEQAAHDGVITHNQIRNPRFQGIQLNNKPAVAAVKNVIVSENAVWMPAGSERPALLAYGDTTFTVDDCQFRGNLVFGGKIGLELHYLVRCAVTGNTVRGALCGTEMHHVRDMAVTGNLLSGCKEEAIRALPYAEIFRNSCLRIEGNTFLAAEGNASPAILLKAVDGYLVSANVCRGFAKELAAEDSGILQ